MRQVVLMGIRARFEKGILRPLEKLNLREGEEVEIEIKRREKIFLKIQAIDDFKAFKFPSLYYGS